MWRASSRVSYLCVTNTISRPFSAKRVSIRVNYPPLRGAIPQLVVSERIASFYWDLSQVLDDGLNCIHFHKIKQEELCILLRGYHSVGELYGLLNYVVGYNDNFKDFVFRHYKDVGDVRSLAGLANMSVRNFQRKFKSEFKRPVHEWLQERRAERILHEIRNTNKGISQIASDHGFASPSYFTTFCKQYFGLTPSALRRRVPTSPDFGGGGIASGL